MEENNNAFKKLILVFYVEIPSGYSRAESHEFIRDVKESTSSDDDKHLLKYFIPVVGQSTKVECLNPPITYISGNTKELDKKIEEIYDKLERVDSILFPCKRRVLTEKIDL